MLRILILICLLASCLGCDENSTTMEILEAAHPLEPTTDIGEIYLAVMPGGNDIIVPINSQAEWSGFNGIWQKTRDGLLYILGDPAHPAPEWGKAHFVQNQYDDNWEHWFYGHAKSKLVYNLTNGNYVKFDGYAGIPAHHGCGHGGTIEFIFFVDDIEVYRSGVIIGVLHNSATHIEFDIPANAQRLTIEVTDADDGICADHWTLGNARLLRE